VVFNWNLGSAGAGGTTDVFYSVAVDLATGDAFAERRLNGISPSVRDSVGFNTSAMAISAYAEDLGITGAFGYYVVSFNRAVGFVDVSPAQDPAPAPINYFTWNLATPGLSTPGAGGTYAGAPIYEDLSGNTISVAYDRNAFIAAESKGLLLLHHHNGFGNRAQAINVKAKKFGS